GNGRLQVLLQPRQRLLRGLNQLADRLIPPDRVRAGEVRPEPTQLGLSERDGLSAHFTMEIGHVPDQRCFVLAERGHAPTAVRKPPPRYEPRVPLTAKKGRAAEGVMNADPPPPPPDQKILPVGENPGPADPADLPRDRETYLPGRDFHELNALANLLQG